jgi:hypothetical protein
MYLTVLMMVVAECRRSQSQNQQYLARKNLKQ